MKKIMFSDVYGLTEAVLNGRKTQTRRIITCPKIFNGEDVAGFHVYRRMSDNAILEYPIMYDSDEFDIEGAYIEPKYNIGEVVAIAQSYKDCGYDATALNRSPKDLNDVRGTLGESKGWNNKMFVRADACKHHIRITNVRVERLQDISDEDCIAEGVEKVAECNNLYRVSLFHKSGRVTYLSGNTPREAYAALIDKISGKGTWKSNPFVFVYDFRLVD